MASWKKLLLKVHREGTDQWVHLCYVEQRTWECFAKFNIGLRYKNLNDWFNKWIKEDFGLKPIVTWDDLESSRMVIKDSFKETYPDLYLETVNDYQGWLRVWVTKHMEKEVMNGKPIPHHRR